MPQVRLKVLHACLLAVAACATPQTEAADPSQHTVAEAQTRPIGSSDGSKIAMDTEQGAQRIRFLASRLAKSDAIAAAEQSANLEIIYPDSVEHALELAPTVHGTEVRWATTDFLARAQNLHWVQATSAGVDRYLSNRPLMENESIVFTNMQGMHGPTIADHVFALLLTLTRDLRVHAQDQNRGQWLRQGSGKMTPVALEGRTLLVVGLGGIGREVAKRGKGFGMTVWATKRRRADPPPYVDRLETSPVLGQMLPHADVIFLCVPLTDETRGLIDAEAFASMKDGSYLINIARGPVVDTAALITALKDGTLAGAGLDVTDPEPLPADHELWQQPNLIITPHVAARSALTSDDWSQLYRENLRRFALGEPLLNVVDKTAGY